jgi:uncharacterized membrane protein ArfC
MNHVHWWLFGLSFVTGLVLTLALSVRPVKREAPVGATSEPATTKLPAADESPTTKIAFIKKFLHRQAPAAGRSPTKHPATKKAPAKKKAPAGKEGPTKKVPGARRVPSKKAPATKAAPPKKAPPAKRAPAKTAPAAEESPTTKIPVTRESLTGKIPGLPYAPYGPGSARATPDGGGPAGWLVKGRSDTRLYYTPDDPTYDPTVAQVWFRDEESAVRACFTAWRKSSRKTP